MKYCGKCGRKLDTEKGLCPNCDKKQMIGNTNNAKPFNKKFVLVPVAIALVCAIITSVLFVTGVISLSPNDKTGGKVEFKDFTEKDVVFENNELFVKNQLLITADNKYNYNDVKNAVSKYNGRIVGCIELTNDYQVEFDDQKSNKNLNELKNSLNKDLTNSEISLHNVFKSDKEKVEKTNEKVKNDLKNGDWWRDAIRLTDLEREKYKYSPVNVGVFDGVIQRSNDNISYAYHEDFNNDESKVDSEKDYHGTQVVGLIASQKGGVSKNSCIYSFSDAAIDNTFKSIDTIMKWKYAIAKLAFKGVKVINISIAFESLSVAAQNNIGNAAEKISWFSNSLCSFLEKMIDKGYDSVIVKGAGNMNNKKWIRCEPSGDHPDGVKAYDKDKDGDFSNHEDLTRVFEAKYDCLGAIDNPKVAKRIIMVGSSNVDNKRSNHSVGGDRIDIYAPGYRLKLLYSNGPVKVGTSFAAPIVTGTIALMYGVNPSLDVDCVKYIIQSSATQPIEDERYQIKTENGDTVYAYKYLINTQNAVNRATSATLSVNQSDKQNGILLGKVLILDANGEKQLVNGECDIFLYKGSKKEAYSALTDSNYKEPSIYSKAKTNTYGEFDAILPEGDYYLRATSKECKSVIKTFKIVKGEICCIDDIVLELSSIQNSTKQSEETTILPESSTEPTTEPETREYTALELADKSLAEIIDIMGGDFEIEYNGKHLIYYTSGGLCIYNDETLPGFAFFVKPRDDIDREELSSPEGNLDDVKTDILSCKYDGFYFMGVYDKAKYDDNISADMTYKEVSEVLNTYELEPIVASSSLRQKLCYDGQESTNNQVQYQYVEVQTYQKQTEYGVFTAPNVESAKEKNPSIKGIVVFPGGKAHG